MAVVAKKIPPQSGAIRAIGGDVTANAGAGIGKGSSRPDDRSITRAP